MYLEISMESNTMKFKRFSTKTNKQKSIVKGSSQFHKLLLNFCQRTGALWAGKGQGCQEKARDSWLDTLHVHLPPICCPSQPALPWRPGGYRQQGKPWTSICEMISVIPCFMRTKKWTEDKREKPHIYLGEYFRVVSAL